jgi:hypothetical protein
MGRKRNKFLPIRLTEEEHSFIMGKINKAIEKNIYKTYGECIYAVFKNANIEVYEFNMQTWDKELKAIGNNINQWTKGINTFNEVSREDVAKLEQEMKNIWQLLRSLKKEITENMENTHLKVN